MLLRELLDAPELGLRLLHGEWDDLERTVRWTYSSDLMDPRRYLVGGDVMLSGLVWRRAESDSETFVSNIASAGAVALVAGEAHFGSVPDDVVEACRRHDVVLFAVPEDVSFSAITEKIISSVALERGARLEAILGRHRQLLSSLAGGHRLEDLVDRVSAETGVGCRVVAATGRHVVHGRGELTDRDRDRVTARFLSADRFPAVVGDGGQATYTIFPVGPALGSRLTMWAVVADGDVTEMSTATVDAFGELATITQVERSRVAEGNRTLRPIADDAMRLVATGATSQAETQVRLRQAGLDTDLEVAVVVVGTGSGTSESVEEDRAIVYEATAELEGVVVAQSPQGPVVALVPCRRDEWEQHLRRVFGRLAPGLGARRLCVGLSDGTSLAGLTGMWEEARHAQQLAALGDEPVSIVAGRELMSHVLLLASVPDDVRKMFATRVLGALVDYDASHGSGLLATVEAFLACSGSWNKAAQQLHLHVNSVRYRIARVEQLTGRDMSRLEDRVDVFLALRSL